ncbi:fungal specific transcription factor domain-containing protein [Trichoderma breve]|uniref:Fungal specific transcription factor domain-containing protein n=1 Tax=Trichoderma breve TaxID=2034170 RepID=A0A9W9JPS1_9HYPO|nr:fungal specific transcription factor domain-containing protein [Trichoderma breve]KAJ4863563.1 fungal specific transcription factor domain-containing protein [Trichoderma breve]
MAMSTFRHRRSAVACQNCRRRKVRCSVQVTGIPCINCSQDGVGCVLLESNRNSRHKQSSGLRHNHSPIQFELNRPVTTASRTVPQQLPQASAEQGPSSIASYSPQGNDSSNIADDSGLAAGTDSRGSPDDQRIGAEISSAALGQSNQAGRPFYTGEAPGFTSVLDACSPSQQPVARHILISEAPISLSAQDREYLQYKGVFTLPQKSTCNELLRAYFHHVHPMMPIVDATVLLKFHETGKASEWNLLLLWSMFFVAANFVDARVWTLEGYSSRKEMKAAMYSRAKCLYDNGGETDKVVLLQSALLMGFWHSKWDGHSQPWYWIGVAISLCQMLGLHRDPDSVKFNTSFPNHQRHLWRRLWWTCFFRDRSLSLTLGRPLRINLNDCNTPMVSSADVLSDLTQIPASIATAYIPEDFSQLAHYWVTLIELSKLLGDVLTLCYQPFGPSPTLRQIELLEAKLLQMQLPERYAIEQSRLASFYLYHLQLHYHAILITFYCPYIAKAPEDLSPAIKNEWQNEMRNKMDSAAVRSNAIVDNIVRDKLLRFACPMTPSLLVSAMHVHLLNCKSTDALSRRLSLNKLELCMMVMEDLEETYTSASVYRGVFMEAIRQLYPNYSGSPAGAASTAGGASLSRATPADDSATLPNINDDILTTLLDEASCFNFWESFSDIQLELEPSL